VSSELIELDWMDVAVAAYVGALRQIKHRKANHMHRWNAPMDNGWTRDIEGACAEKAAAKSLGNYWFDGADGKTDVGPYQVRHTTVEHGRLVLHPEDKDDEIFILVVGRAPTFRIVGWCLGRDGKNPSYWSDPTGGRPAFFVPNNALHAMDKLRQP
jgi:hypothetical protein